MISQSDGFEFIDRKRYLFKRGCRNSRGLENRTVGFAMNSSTNLWSGHNWFSEANYEHMLITFQAKIHCTGAFWDFNMAIPAGDQSTLQGMMADTGGEFHLHKGHNTFALITD